MEKKDTMPLFEAEEGICVKKTHTRTCHFYIYNFGKGEGVGESCFPLQL